MGTKARIAGAVTALALVAVPATAFAGGETPPPPPDPCKSGRMTGGGNALGTANGAAVKVTHGFTLRCNADANPQRLEINWSGGNRFHLETLTSATCTDTALDEENPDAGFDTFKGTGTGRLNGVSGAKIKFTFSDDGEPGDDDGIKVEIRDRSDKLVLSVNGTLTKGNHQAHRVTGALARL